MTEKTGSGRPMLKEGEYAAFINKSEHSARRDRRLGRAPKFYKINGAIRYRWEDVEAFLKANEGRAVD